MKENTNNKKNMNFKEKLINFIKFFVLNCFSVFFLFLGLFYILNDFDIIKPDKIEGIKFFIICLISIICFSVLFLIILLLDWLIFISVCYLLV